MQWKDYALRGLLAIGALATVATSPPPNFELVASDEIETVAPDVRHLTLSANAAASRGVDAVFVEIELGDLDRPLVIVPDDPALEVVEAVGRASIDLTEQCDGPDGCEAGLSVDVSGEGPITIFGLGRLVRFGDPSFFFPEDRDFSDEAAVELRFDGR